MRSPDFPPNEHNQHQNANQNDRMKTMHPESLMMSLGYDPQTANGAVKAPLFASSTYVFPNAESGKARFAAAHGEEGGEPGLVYARLNHPGLQLAEERLRIWDGAEDCAIFHSGMSAISTTLLAYLKPGDALLFNGPIYGGSDHLIRHILTDMGVQVLEFNPHEPVSAIAAQVRRAGLQGKVRMIFVETPANPTNDLVSISKCRKLADQLSNPESRVLVAVDNTFLGPLWQKPLKHGADLVIYSATKYIGGHSDLIAGAVCASTEHLAPVKMLRVFLGTAAGPWVSWLLLRSMETMSLRMERQATSASTVANYLAQNSGVTDIRYLGFLGPEHKQNWQTYQEQCEGPGAMISFYLEGGEKEAFRFLNALELVRLAVSLGGTESLAEHPASMTHSGMDEQTRQRLGITDNLIRLSVGVEHPDDIIADLERGFAAIQIPAAVTATGR